MTLVFPLDPLVETVPVVGLLPLLLVLLVAEDEEELWWLLLLERNPSPLMRFESSAEARSTTPWAEIDDIFIMCRWRPLGNNQLSNPVLLLVVCITDSPT